MGSLATTETTLTMWPRLAGTICSSTACGVYDAHVVGLQLILDLVHASFEERLVQAVTGVVDQHVHPPPALDGRLHEVPNLPLIRDVDYHHENLAWRSLELLTRALETVVQSVTDGYAATFSGERSDSLRADTTGTGDHDHHATQIYHGSVLRFSAGLVIKPVGARRIVRICPIPKGLICLRSPARALLTQARRA